MQAADDYQELLAALQASAHHARLAVQAEQAGYTDEATRHTEAYHFYRDRIDVVGARLHAWVQSQE